MARRQIPYATEQGSSNGYQGRFPRRVAKRDERFGIKLHRKSDDWFDTSKTWAAWTRGTGDRCELNQRIVTPHGSLPTATSAIFTPRSTSMTDTDPERPHAT